MASHRILGVALNVRHIDATRGHGTSDGEPQCRPNKPYGPLTANLMLKNIELEGDNTYQLPHKWIYNIEKNFLLKKVVVVPYGPDP